MGAGVADCGLRIVDCGLKKEHWTGVDTPSPRLQRDKRSKLTDPNWNWNPGGSKQIKPFPSAECGMRKRMNIGNRAWRVVDQGVGDGILR